MSLKDRQTRKRILKQVRKAESSGRGASVLGVAWYTPGQWQALTRVVPDRSKLDDTYDRWKQSAEETLAMLRSEGMVPIPIHLEVGELMAWCEEQGCQPDGAARARYTSELLRRFLTPDPPERRRRQS
jgi:hypothetical protein